MPVEIRVVNSRRDLKEFIFLPAAIHAQHSAWLPPVYSDEWKFNSSKHNKSLLYSETCLWLAYKDGKLSGRIMGIINKKHNELYNEKSARFFNLECYNDQEVSHALIAAAEYWAVERGMSRMTGPFGFSDKDPQGLQISGFEYLPVIATATNFPYLKHLVEAEGYNKEVDCFVYKLDIPERIPDFIQRIYDRLINSKKYRVIEFTKTGQLKNYIIPVLRLVNETYKSLYGFIPMTEAEMFQLAKTYLPVLDPKFTKLVVDENNKILAFVVASPDMSTGIQKAKGKIFPFGFLHILNAMRTTEQLDLFLGAVHKDFQSKGLTVLLAVKIFESAWKRKMKFIDSHLILETNKPMNALMQRLNAGVYKSYRIYSKSISK